MGYECKRVGWSSPCRTCSPSPWVMGIVRCSVCSCHPSLLPAQWRTNKWIFITTTFNDPSRSACIDLLVFSSLGQSLSHIFACFLYAGIQSGLAETQTRYTKGLQFAAANRKIRSPHQTHPFIRLWCLWTMYFFIIVVTVWHIKGKSLCNIVTYQREVTL